jgi:hypothetical protein
MTSDYETPRADPKDHPKDTSSLSSPQVENSWAVVNAPTGDRSVLPWVKEIPQSPPQVGSLLTQDPDFIKVGCHLGKYITFTMNTEEEQEDIRVL